MIILLALLSCTPKDALDDSGGSGTGPTPAPLRAAEPAAWAAPGSTDTTTFPWGPQSGDPTQDSVILSVRTDLDSVTGLLVADDGAGGWTEVARPTLLRDSDSIVARATVDGLAADTVHAWAAYGDDPELAGARSVVGRFRTATDDSSFRQLTIATTSCLGGNEPLSNMSAAAARAPDLTLLLGDTVYADGSTTLEDYRAFWEAAFVVSGLSDTTSGSGLSAIWDDHEVANDYVRADIDDAQFDAALQAYREGLPQGQGPDGGVWRKLSWGAILDVFMLDVRSQRDADAGLYIGEEQEAWLLDGLASSTATFKLIATSVPMTDYDDFLGELVAEDRWQGWPEQRSRVLSAIEDADVEGVLWLGGDVHFAAVSTVAIPGSGDPGEGMWEAAVGPAGRSLNVAADLYEHDDSHYKVLFAEYNTTILTFDPALLQVGIDYLGDDGFSIAQITLSL